MGSIFELKRLAVERLLEQEDYFLLVLDPRQEGLVLPDDLLQAGQPIPINIGLRMAIPIPDLAIDDDGIRATLSFDRTPFACVIPWAAVLRLSLDDEHLVWVTPPELKEPPKREQRPKLKLV